MNNKLGNIRVMLRLIGLIKPLMGFMLIAICMGVAGFLCAIFIPYFASLLISHIFIRASDFPIYVFFVMMGVLAVLRGILHYIEQACNHYIAFTILAIIRDKIFRALRRLCPAKLEGKDAGDLIVLITSDIELLEVFYAHTISPILIAIITSSILIVMFAYLHPMYAVIAAIGYVVVGLIIPIIITKKGKQAGNVVRSEFGAMSAYTLESLRGMQEVLQYQIGDDRLHTMHEKSNRVNLLQKHMKEVEGLSLTLSGIGVTVFSFLVFLLGSYFYMQGEITFTTLLMSTVLMISSFGPVLALSALSNNLLVTLASGRRVLHLLDEKEEVKDIVNQEQAVFGEINVHGLNFAYDAELILNDMNISFEENRITGILGKSGSGKSTLLKLIMRFWNIDDEKLFIHNRDINTINTSDLRDFESYVTQDTVLFHDTILNNIKIANINATPDEVEAACKKASIHDFIMSLPKTYNTEVAELGDSLSGGERQRLGIARAFLHDSSCILLDEPTSNLDALNEAVILKSLKEQTDKTILLVSHRASTMKIADQVICVENGRLS